MAKGEVYGQLLPWPDLSPRNEAPVRNDNEFGWDLKEVSLLLMGTKQESKSS